MADTSVNAMKKTIIAAITIGQAPRTDITADIRPMLSPSIELREYGALDLYSKAECEKQFGPRPGDAVLVSRMRDGSQVKMAESAVIPLVQDCICRAEKEGAKATVLLCTGHLPSFRHERFLLIPQPVIHSMVKALAQDSTVGVIVPDQDQQMQVEQLFSSNGVSVVTAAASPYLESDKMKEAATAAAKGNPAFIYLDCMGYSANMKQAVHQASGLPVVLPRTMIARMINELFA